MTIGEIQGALGAAAVSDAGRRSDPINPEQAAKNREIAKAVKAINEGGGVGPSSEAHFSIDEATGQPLIKIVDRLTNEVITQFPPETALRTAEILRSLQPGERIA